MLLYNIPEPTESAFVIPQTYQQWRHCIEVECGLALTGEFIDARIQELARLDHFRTQQFVRLYGESHRARVLDWFRQAGAEA